MPSHDTIILTVSITLSDISKKATFHIRKYEVRKIKTIKNEKKLCLICMEEHEVQTVIRKDIEAFKGEEVSFDATYEYCVHAGEYLETEDMIKANSLAMKDAYRKKVGRTDNSSPN
jgi:hypothetical protein